MHNEFIKDTKDTLIKKTRLTIPYRNVIIELNGIVVAEIEFADVDDAAALSAMTSFVIPDWFGLEVTDDPACKNKSLAMNGLPSQDSTR